VDRATTERLAERLEGVLNAGVRTVAYGDVTANEYEVVRMRDDIGKNYPNVLRRKIFEGLVVEYYRRGWEEDLFEPLGGFDYTVQVFATGMNVIGWGDGSVVFIGLDRDPTLLEQVVETLDAVVT
jgi:hypothetical protein